MAGVMRPNMFSSSSVSTSALAEDGECLRDERERAGRCRAGVDGRVREFGDDVIVDLACS